MIKMHVNTYSLIVVILLAAYSQALQVQKCEGSKVDKPATENIKISKCEKPPCILKRRTSTQIEMKFTPNRDFETLRQDIQGIILGVPLPFPGVYDTDACPFIYDEEGNNKVGCPLKADTTYTYKNGFKVLPIYPPVNVVVHWGLAEKIGGDDAICFRVPAKIK